MLTLTKSGICICTQCKDGKNADFTEINEKSTCRTFVLTACDTSSKDASLGNPFLPTDALNVSVKGQVTGFWGHFVYFKAFPDEGNGTSLIHCDQLGGIS